jgi:type I restriction enzyme M protein
VSLWILNRNKKDNPNFRNREHEILFIDARHLGEMIDRRHRELKDEDIKKIADTYHNWRNLNNGELRMRIKGLLILNSQFSILHSRKGELH